MSSSQRICPSTTGGFGVTPVNSTDVHVKLGRDVNLDRCLCLKTDRTVRNDHTVAHDGKLYQITQPVLTRKVIVEERIDGSVHISAGGVSLKYRELTERPRKANPPARPREIKKPRPPSTDHPWRKAPLKTVIRKQMYLQTTK